MILSGRQILEQIQEKNIGIDPFEPKRIGPNSYNLTLHESLQCYEGDYLDMAARNRTKDLIIPKEGLMLQPGELYLGRTVEHTETTKFVPMLEGRSSVGRLGIFIHITAGFGDVGFSGTWTLEITVLKPTIVYPNIPICQIYFHTIEGDFDLYKSKKYQGQQKVVSSKFWKDIVKIPSTLFFEDLKEAFDDLLVMLGRQPDHIPGPIRFIVEPTDEKPESTEKTSYKSENLKDYVFNHLLEADLPFPEMALHEFYAEIPCCLDHAWVTMKCDTSGNKCQIPIRIQ